MPTDVKTKLGNFLKKFTETVPVEYAALIHIPTGETITRTITPAVPHSYFEENIEKFKELIDLSEEIAVTKAMGDLYGTILRGSKGYEIVARLSESVLLVCGGTDVGSLGITLLRIVELKDTIKKREREESEEEKKLFIIFFPAS